MNRGLLFFAVAASAALLAASGYQQYFVDSDGRFDQLYENQSVLAEAISAVSEEASARIVDLPEDGGKWYTVLCLHDKSLTNSQDRRLVGAFAADGRLQSLKAQTNMWMFDQDDRLWKSQYSRQMGGELPQLWVIRSKEGMDKGQVIYKVSGAATQIAPGDIGDEIEQAIKDHCPRPGPNPSPYRPPPTPSWIPDIRPQTPSGPLGNELPVVYAILAALGAAAVGVYFGGQED